MEQPGVARFMRPMWYGRSAYLPRSEHGAALVKKSVEELGAVYELHQSVDGNFQVRDRAAGVGSATSAGGVGGGWLNGLADHTAATQRLQFDRKATPVPHPIAFDGLGFGWLFLHLLSATERSCLTYSCAVYVVTPAPVELAMLFHMHDLQNVMGQARVRWIVGDSAEAALAELGEGFSRHWDWSVPARVVQSPLIARSVLALEGEINKVRSAREKMCGELIGQIERQYSGRDARWWGRRYAEASAEKPLRVLGITSRYTTVLRHSMAELQTAVEAAGCQMEVAMEPDDASLENPFLEKLSAFAPDLIVQISRMRYENAQLPRNVPFLCWDQDNLPCMRTAAATESLDDLTFVAGHGALQGYAHLGWPARQVILCPLAAATHRYAPRMMDAELLARHACDFSYVSNAAESPAALCKAHLARFAHDAHAATLFGAFCERLIHTPAPEGIPWHDDSVRALLLQLAGERGMTVPDAGVQEMVMSGVLIADRAFRHETLEWVSGFCRARNKKLRLYGAGWESHPTLGIYAAGVAQAGEELQAITQATRINLQIIGTGVLHPRLLDGLAAGGFFMFRRTHHDHLDAAFLAARDVVSRHVASEMPRRLLDLDRVENQELAAAWRVIRANYVAQQAAQRFDDAVVLRSLATAHQLAHPLVAIPGAG